MSKTGYEIKSVEKITDSKNQTYICRIRAPIPTQIRNDQNFLALFGNAQMKQGKINFYAPLEKGGILFCNCRSVGR